MNIHEIFAALAIAAALLSILFFSCASGRESEPESTGTAATRKVAETSASEETGTETGRKKHSSLKLPAAYETLPEAVDTAEMSQEAEFETAAAGSGAQKDETVEPADADTQRQREEQGTAAPATAAGKEGTAERTSETAASEPVRQSTAAAGEPSADAAAGSEPAAQTQPEETAPEETAHVHQWTAVTETVWVVDREARTEEIYEERPVYELIYVNVCNECGFEDEDSYTVNMHIITEHADTGGRGYRQERRQGALIGTEQVLTGRIDYPEEGHWEERTTGYICEDCGASR